MPKPKGSPKHGGRQKGARNKATLDAISGQAIANQTLKELVMPHCIGAIERIAVLSLSENESIALAANQALLDRGYGKPSQHIEQETKSLVVVADAEQAELGRRIAFLLERAGKTDLLQ